jgi:hypothetical protein
MTKSLGLRDPDVSARKRLAEENARLNKEIMELKAKQPSSEAVKNLGNFGITMYLKGDLPASDLSRLAWFMDKCGLKGFEDLMTDPNSHSFHNSSTKVADILGLTEIENKQLTVSLPACRKSGVRSIEDVASEEMLDVAAEEFLENPDAILAHSAALQISCKNWREHAIHEDCSEDEVAVPFGMFIDGAPWRKGAGSHDSVSAVYINIIGETKRRCILTIRKEHLCGISCGCPCRGRCTIQAAEQFIAWQIAVAFEGTWSKTDHRNFHWTSRARDSQAGQARLMWKKKRIRCGLMECRNDWDQYSSSWGMPKTNQRLPCWFCPVEKCNMHDDELPEPRTHESYMQEVSTSRVQAAISLEDARRVFAALIFDFRDSGMHGRVCNRNIEVYDVSRQLPVLLKKWDRLELGGSVLDIHCSAETMRLQGSGPYILHFWRKGVTHSFAHISPIMEARGMRFEYLMIGDLHTLDIGVTGRLVGHCMVEIIKARVKLGNGPGLQGMGRGTRALSKRLRAHYSQRRWKSSRIGRVTLKMLQFHKLGDEGHLKAKGMETRSTLLFTHRLLRGSQVPHETELRRATGALLQAYRLMRTSGRSIDSDKLEDLLEKVSCHCKGAGVGLLPKHHLARHFGELSRRAGNPAKFSEYADESKNREIVKMAQGSAHGREDFSGRLLSRDRLLQGIYRELDN